MNKYEVLYVISCEIDEVATKETVEKFKNVITQNGGTVDSVDEWGKRRLAYPINYKNEGYYVLMKFSAAPSLPEELERIFRITEPIIRFLVTRLEA